MKYFLRQYKLKIILIILIAIATTAVTYSTSPTKYRNKVSKIDPDKKYKVAYVLDGDTFGIKVGKMIEIVRMLGIDTPETVDPRKPVQCFGREASEMTKNILLHHEVKLEIDKHQSAIDKFGRLLAYTYRDDGLFVNEFLLKNGFAREYTYNKIYGLQKQFRALQEAAKTDNLGLWGKCDS